MNFSLTMILPNVFGRNRLLTSWCIISQMSVSYSVPLSVLSIKAIMILVFAAVEFAAQSMIVYGIAFNVFLV